VNDFSIVGVLNMDWGKSAVRTAAVAVLWVIVMCAIVALLQWVFYGHVKWRLEP
jgi:hypothetical protein